LENKYINFVVKMGDLFDAGATLNGKSQSVLLGEAAFGTLTQDE
jgi:hypothetical protein